MTRFLARCASVLLAIALLTPAAWASEERVAAREPGFFAALWYALVELMPAVSDLGPGLDPGGTPTQSGSSGGPPPGDLGPGMDPGGTPGS